MNIDRAWIKDAYCRNNDIPPEVFYLPQEIDPDTLELLPVDEADPAVAARIACAKSICARCVVVQKCLDKAVEQGIVSGENVIWGGQTYEDRCVIRLARAARGDLGSTQAS